jgi:hypothetical protein
MKKQLLKIANQLLRPFSAEVRKIEPRDEDHGLYDLSDLEKAIFRRVSPFTMTSPERVAVLVEAVRHVVSAGIVGDIVVCGVGKGGSAMAAGLALQSADARRHLWLYDTFEGMSEPTAADVAYDGESAREQLEVQDIRDSRSVWCYSPLDEVRENVGSIGYPPDRVHYVKGRVEDTLPGEAPESIALLRLDTDWYESTRHELMHLYPRLSAGGILIIDDYGYWKGSRKAVDEYFQDHSPRPLLVRIDATARIAIKP